MGAFADDLFGDASASPALGEEDMRRLVQRVERRVRYGRLPANVAEATARAAETAEMAREIGQALDAGDRVRAGALIREGAALFGHQALLAAVQAQATQAHDAALAPVREVHRRGQDPWANGYEPDYLDGEDWSP